MPAHIAIISTSYPSPRDPGGGSFVQKLARDLIELGVTTTVISPLKAWHKKEAVVHGENTSRVEPVVIRPRYISCSSKIIPGIGSTFLWTIRNLYAAVHKEMLKLETPPSHIYGQFLFPSGYAAAKLSREMGSKSVVDLGESFFDHYEKQLGIQKIKQTLNEIDSVVTVAEHLTSRCINSYDVPETKILTARNAASTEFSPLSKRKARDHLKLPQNRPIIGYIGAFDTNKRPMYVLEAIKQRPETCIFFLGRKGTQEPQGNQVLFAGSVPHDQVHIWLSAADLFVHASLSEMSSNAVAEAKACGLPIIATDIPGNREILDPNYAILVDPWDQHMLSQAIFKLVDNPEQCRRMSRAAQKAAQQYTSLDRARSILSWITK